MLFELGTSILCKEKYLVRSFMVKSNSYVCTLNIKDSLEFLKLWRVSQKTKSTKTDRCEGFGKRSQMCRTLLFTKFFELIGKNCKMNESSFDHS